MNHFDRMPVLPTALVVFLLLLLQSITMRDEQRARLHQSAMATELKRCGAHP